MTVATEPRQRYVIDSENNTFVCSSANTQGSALQSHQPSQQVHFYTFSVKAKRETAVEHLWVLDCDRTSEPEPFISIQPENDVVALPDSKH